MSLKQNSGTTDSVTDAEIMNCIETIEFDFGARRYTVGEAGLLFVYETGYERKQMYVIALSVNCGSVIFYIPEDIMELITERAWKLNSSPGKYVSDLIEARCQLAAVVEFYGSSGITKDEAIAAFDCLSKEWGQLAASSEQAADAIGRFPVLYGGKS